MAIQIKCSKCGKVLGINPSKNAEEALLECSGCKQKVKVKEYYPQLCLNVLNQSFQLKFGKQWVGRKCSDQVAQVVIPDESTYMSRRHGIIEVSCAPTGLTITFEEHGTNPTVVQGIDLQQLRLTNGRTIHDKVYLVPNDVLKLGHVNLYIDNQFGEQLPQDIPFEE